MSARTRALRLLGLLAAAAMLALSAGFTWSVVDDYGGRNIVPEGVELSDGTRLSGLSRSEARKLIQKRVVMPLLEPLQVVHGSTAYVIDPATMLSIDVDAMLEAAFHPNASATLAERTLRRVGISKLATITVEPKLAIDRAALAKWIGNVASQVDSPPVDAAIYIDAGKIVIRRSSEGLATDTSQNMGKIAHALLTGAKRVDLAVDIITPKIRDEDLGKTIVVRISQRKLYLYEGLSLKKTYRIAVGAQGYSTPLGSWKITLKRYMPWWHNPGSEWAKDMPASIPPGPNNPLGTRALNLNAPAIRIHGTTQNSSIGTAASRGCMRMHRWDIEDLYERVDVGTPVLIVR